MLMVNIFVQRVRLHAPTGQIAGLPKGALTITLPRSHSKCMRFRGQRHRLVFRLLWSPLAPAPFPDAAPYESYRREGGASLGVSLASGLGRVPTGQTASGCAQRGYATERDRVNFTID